MSDQDELARLRQQNAALAAALEKLDRVVRDIIFVTDSDSAARIGYDALHEAFPSGYREILSSHDAAVRRPLLEALRNLRNLAVEAANADVACALSKEPGSAVFGSSGCASKSALAEAKQAWKRVDNCVDEILSRYNDDGSERK